MKLREFLMPSCLETRWVKDLAFCTAAYFILISIFASSSKWQLIDHIYTSIFLGTLIFFGAVNEMFIQQKFLKRKKYLMFFGLTLVNILVGAYFNHFLFDTLIDHILPGYYFISYYEYFDLVKFFFVYIFLLTLLGLSWEWFQFQETRHQITVLEKEKIDAELKALTNQVNPHFLFNSLTLVYGLALKKSDETPDAVLKLSNTLRYVIYESSRGKVTLASEIALIKNYIDLQRYRIRPGSIITFTHDVTNDAIQIEPMLLLPLVENSFKHGLMGDSDDGFIRIDLRSDESEIVFSITNNKGISTGAKETGGVGLENIKNRLKLVYKNGYRFNVTETEKDFTVHLRLKVSV